MSVQTYNYFGFMDPSAIPADRKAEIVADVRTLQKARSIVPTFKGADWTIAFRTGRAYKRPTSRIRLLNVADPKQKSLFRSRYDIGLGFNDIVESDKVTDELVRKALELDELNEAIKSDLSIRSIRFWQIAIEKLLAAA